MNFKNHLLSFLKNILPVHLYRITGNSMEPALQNGEFVAVNKLLYLFRNPMEGDIVAMIDPRGGRVLIKRITGIEKNKYFVEGDNKDESTDSRHFGYLDRESIIGKVIWSSHF